MNEQAINILVKMRADIDQALNKLNGGLDNVRKNAESTNKGMIKGFKDQLAPLNTLRTTILRVGAIWAATGGVIIAAMNNVNEKLKDVDRTAAQLGVSADELSRRMYGFNIATNSTRVGVGQLELGLQTLRNAWIGVGNAVAYAVGKEEIEARASGLAMQRNATQKRGIGDMLMMMGAPASGRYGGWGNNVTDDDRKEAERQLLAEAKARRANSEEAVQIETGLKAKIVQLKGDELAATKNVLDQERNYYITTYGADSEIVKTYDQFATLTQQKATLAYWGVKDIADITKQTFQGVTSNVTNSLTTIFSDVLMNETKKGKDYIEDFGKSMLKMIAQVIAQLLVLQAVKMMVGSVFGIPLFHEGGQVPQKKVGVSFSDSQWGSKYHLGGAIPRAHSGLATDEVPIIAQTGEGILSRKGMASLGLNNFNRLNRGEGGGNANITIQPIITISAFNAADIMRNRKDIEAIFVDSLQRNNQSLRNALKQYG